MKESRVNCLSYGFFMLFCVFRAFRLHRRNNSDVTHIFMLGREAMSSAIISSVRGRGIH